jgi:hypothetical protein
MTIWGGAGATGSFNDVWVLTNAAGIVNANSISLVSTTLTGGAGDQTGDGLSITGGNIYVGGESGEFVRFAVPPTTPTASSVLNGGNFVGMTSTGTTVYPVGGALPPSCGASDGVGDTEGKSMVALYDASSAAFVNCQSTNFFPYRGGEGYHAAVNDGSILYAVGSGETCGFGNYNFVLSKFDLSGSLLSKVTDPGVDFGGQNCIRHSNAGALALLNGNLYLAGLSDLSAEDGVDRPVLMRYTTALTRDWKVRPTDNSGGAFNGVTALGNYIYAVGYVGVSPNYDYLIEKYDEAGNRIWSKTSGGAGQDMLNAVIAVGGRLFAVGSTNSQGAGGLDAVLLEIDPTTGDTLLTTTYGGTQDDVAYSVATDGTDLYVVGGSRSFASADGNNVGQSDIMLLRYSMLTLPVNSLPSPPSCSLSATPTKVQAGQSVTATLACTVTVNDALSGMLNWGDGSGNSTSSAIATGGSASLLFTHTYTTAGSPTDSISATLADTTSTLAGTVSPASVAISIFPAPVVTPSQPVVSGTPGKPVDNPVSFAGGAAEAGVVFATITCTVTPTATCTWSPATLTLDANGNGTLTVTVTPPAITKSLLAPMNRWPKAPLFAFLIIPLSGLGLVFLGASCSKARTRSATRWSLALLLTVSILLTMGACGGSSSSSTSFGTSVTYSANVHVQSTATSQMPVFQANGIFTVTVQ